MDTGCIAQISILIYSVTNKIIVYRENGMREFLKLGNTAIIKPGSLYEFSYHRDLETYGEMQYARFS